MNAVCLLTVSAIVCLVGVGARADDKADNAKKLVGKWEISKADPQTIPVGSVLEFLKDGKIKITIKENGEDKTLEGTYSVEKDVLTVVRKTDEGERKRMVTIKKISDTELVIVDDESKVVEMTRKK